MTEARVRVRRRKPVRAQSRESLDRRRKGSARQKESKARHQQSSHREAEHAPEAGLDPSARLSGLSIDTPDVQAVDLPHRPLMEDRFGRSLTDVEVLTGPAVSAALDGLSAEAAELDGRIYLRSAEASPGVIAHEVAHALQRPQLHQEPPGPTEAAALAEAPTVAPAVIPEPQSRVERDAQRTAVQGGPPSAALPFGVPALLQQGQPATKADGTSSTGDGSFQKASDPAASKQSDTQDAQDPQATQKADGSKDPNGTKDPAAQDADAQPAIEQTKPTFAPPAIPDTQLSPEEQAKRKAELEAAKEKFDQADSAGGTVEAVKDMPPSAKALHQGSMGAKVGEVVAADQKKFEAEAPKIEARMGGEQDVGEVPKVEAPAIGDVKLGEGQVAPTQKPDLPPTADPQSYQGNKAVKSLMDKFFSLFGFGKDSIDKSFKEVNTGDNIDTSPGPKPKVPRAKGTETDDERIDRDKAQSKQESEKAGLAAQQKILDGPGPEQAKTREQTESRPLPEFQKVEAPAVTTAEGAQSFQQIAAREDESLVAQFDKDQHESMQQSLVEAQQKTAEAEAERDTKRKEEMDKAETERKAVEEKADTDQKAKVLEARKTIQTERQKTVDAQAAEVKSVEKESENARKEERGKIKKRVEDDEKAISTKYDEKEGEAKKELTKGEDKAAKEKEKSEKESENQSWWDRAKSWVKEQFAKLTAVIGKIFDAVRSLVKKALDAARKFAKDLIDAAAAFIKKAIEVFGELVKGLVNVLVGTFFPDLAKKLNEAIDGAVALAKKGVDFVAEQMKKGVDFIVDTLQKGIDAVLNAFQAALNFAISLVQAALTGDWGAVFKQLLEAALKLLGIDPKEFYAFVAKVQDTLGLIVDKPGQFLSNVLGAVKLGFSLFSDNFLKHLKAGVIGWLTGSLGGDIQMPKTFDLLGILDLVRQLLGLTWDWLKKRAAKIIGEKNVERLEFLFSYVDTLRKEGWGGLFKRIQEDLTGLKEKVLGQIGEFLTIQVIKAAVLWLAGLFNPVGALVKVVMTVWNIYTFLRDQLSRIMQVVKTVVGALDKIARGVIEEAGKKVESVLGFLVPVAIDLLAKLLGLTGVTAKVRSILKAVNQSITKTVDKVLKKVAAKFKGKGKGKGKGKEKGKQAGEGKPTKIKLGKPLPVKVPQGKGHTLSIDQKGKDALVTLRSEPKPVFGWLNHFQSKLSTVSPAKARSAADKDLKKATGIVRQLDKDADKHLSAALLQTSKGKKSKTPKAQTSDEKILKAQGHLRDSLVRLFVTFGHPGFEAELNKAHKDVKTDLKKALADRHDKYQGKPWAEVRKVLEDSVPPFSRPLLKAHTFGSNVQNQVRTALADENEYPEAPRGKEVDSFLRAYLVRRVNNEGGVYAEARKELQNVMFNGGATQPLSAKLKAALKAALEAANKGEGADTELKKDAGGGPANFIAFLIAMAKSQNHRGLKHTDWKKVYWGKTANREWIKSKFRAGGGEHEWVPTNYIGRVVERARKAQVPEGAEAAGMWMRFQNEFRTKTKFLIYQPKGGTVQTVPHTRDPQDSSKTVGGQAQVLQGHVGAVYAPVKQNNYDDKNRVVSQVKGQGPWHDGLRKIFDDQFSSATTKSGVRNVIQGMTFYAADTLWFGSPAPSGDFKEYYAAQKGAADGKNLVTPEQLASRAKDSVDEIQGDIDRTRKSLGL